MTHICWNCGLESDCLEDEYFHKTYYSQFGECDKTEEYYCYSCQESDERYEWQNDNDESDL
jgi:hypothetical protein